MSQFLRETWEPISRFLRAISKPINRFLRETWELWYWAVFRPRKLQERMNTWAPVQNGTDGGERPNTSYHEILLIHPDARFVAQFWLLELLLVLPLTAVVVANRGLISSELVLILLVLVYAYWLSTLVLTLGLHLPILFMLVYLDRSTSLHQWFVKLFDLSFLSANIWVEIWLEIGVMSTVLLILVSYWFYPIREKIFSERRRTAPSAWVWLVFLILIDLYNVLTASAAVQVLSLAGGVVVIVVVISILFGGEWIHAWRHDKNSAIVVIVTITLIIVIGALLALSFRNDYQQLDFVKNSGFFITVIIVGIIAGVITHDVLWIRRSSDTGSLVGFMSLISGILLIGLLPLMAGFLVSSLILIVAGLLQGLLVLPLLPLSLMMGWLIAGRRPWESVGLASVMVLIGFSQPQGLAALWAVPAMLLGYYRLLPDYPLLTVLSLRYELLLPPASRDMPLHWLQSLPPHSDELVWLPLPGHERILIAAFRIDASAALPTLQQMRASPLPGLRRTIRWALPQIVADQFLVVDSPASLVETATPEHPVLPLLVPEFYGTPAESAAALTAATADAEIRTLLPRLQGIARDVGAALEAGSAFLRQRGLDACLTTLTRLQGQLPGLGLGAQALPRWGPVLERWQAVVTEEIGRQQATAVGEVINPFQSGNPLRADRAYLFKGRRQFADDIVRQVLDRARPTLVLFGPRRCGKSSFLLNLPRLLPGDIFPVYLDLQSAALTGSEADFCYGLVRAVGRDLRSQRLAAPEAQRDEFRASPYTALEDWLDHALPLPEGRRLLICLDEFEKLGSAVAEGRLSLRLFDELRHLIQHQDALGFLFCGVQTLDELGPQWSSYFISVQPIEMLYLEPSEAREVLEDPDPQFNLRYADGIVERVLGETRGQPYLLQLVGEAMVGQANQQHASQVTDDLLTAALQAALTAGQPYFTNLWEEPTGVTPTEQAAGRRLLYALAHNQPLPPVEDDATRAALRRLVRYHVLERSDGGYRFEIPLVARWMRERAVFD